MMELSISIIIQCLTLLLALYLALSKSYFQEKGKNIATKEDINEITQKVESVKAEFHILTHSRTSLNVVKWNAFLNYFDKYFLWLNSLLDTSFANTDLYNNDETDKYLEKLNRIYIDLCNAETRMHLWTDDIELMNLTTAIKIEILGKFHNLTKSVLQDIKRINQNIKEQILLPQIERKPLEPLYNEFSRK